MDRYKLKLPVDKKTKKHHKLYVKAITHYLDYIRYNIDSISSNNLYDVYYDFRHSLIAIDIQKTIYTLKLEYFEKTLAWVLRRKNDLKIIRVYIDVKGSLYNVIDNAVMYAYADANLKKNSQD